MRAVKLNFTVMITILEWFSYFLITISNGSEYPTVFEMLYIPWWYLIYQLTLQGSS